MTQQVEDQVNGEEKEEVESDENEDNGINETNNMENGVENEEDSPHVDNGQGPKEIEIVEIEENEDGDEDEDEDEEEDKDTASSKEDQPDMNPRSGAEIQSEQTADIQEDEKEEENDTDEDSSIELIEPRKLTIEEISFQILSERSRGVMPLTGAEPTEGTEEENYESIRLFLSTEIRDFNRREEFHERFTESINDFF